MEVKEVLEKALAFYDDHEWIQGHSFSYAENGIAGGCLEGACCWAIGDETGHLLAFLYPEADLNMHARTLLRDAAYELFPERFPFGRLVPVHKFNDDELTTREDALLVLKHAIGKADGCHDREERAS